MLKKNKKRILSQTFTFLASNSYLKGFVLGSIYTGPLKQICVPGLNCYSCPGALGACPIGAMQAVAGGLKYSLSYYITGILILFGTLLGRFICGWLCPFGLVQDLLYRVKSKKIMVPYKADRPLRYLKYAVLFILVLLLPLVLTNQFGIAPPYFCKFLCPSGTLFGGIPLLLTNSSLRELVGLLFDWKLLLLITILVLSVFIARPFCKYLCPLGAFYAMFNQVSLIRQTVDPDKCTNCGRCKKACPMQVDPCKNPNHSECIRCGICKDVCYQGAISNCRICSLHKKRKPRPV